MAFDVLPSRETIDTTIETLERNGVSVVFVETAADARSRVLEMIPERSEVMNMTSRTLTGLGLDKEILESGRYDAVRNKWMNMDRKTQAEEMNQLGAAPEWVLGSVHAVTMSGSLMFASNTGSQLPAYAYGALHVLWVVGAQKIVKDVDEGFRRIYEWCLPHERERALAAYGPGTTTDVNKLLIMNKEKQKDRITMVMANEVIGI